MSPQRTTTSSSSIMLSDLVMDRVRTCLGRPSIRCFSIRGDRPRATGHRGGPNRDAERRRGGAGGREAVRRHHDCPGSLGFACSADADGSPARSPSTAVLTGMAECSPRMLARRLFPLAPTWITMNIAAARSGGKLPHSCLTASMAPSDPPTAMMSRWATAASYPHQRTHTRRRSADRRHRGFSGRGEGAAGLFRDPARRNRRRLRCYPASESGRAKRTRQHPREPHADAGDPGRGHDAA
jgi:hypothetical protein